MKHAVARFLRIRGEAGAALVLVIVLGAVMMLIVGTAVAMSIGGLRSAKTSEDWNGALAAAYAGLEEYQNRLANDSTYTKYGNPDAEFSKTTGVKVSLPTDDPNPAFGLGTGGWATVPGSEGQASFRYEVDNSKYTANGVLTVRSTGRVGAETRSVVADLKQKGFIDFLYFTDYEVQDPTQGGKNCTPTYTWNSTNQCTKISFADNDKIEGPLHSNDTLYLCGTYNGPVTTANTKSSNYQRADDCPSDMPIFNAGVPKTGQLIGMPATNAQMKRETRSDLPTEVPRPGCLYTGPTSILLKDNGTMVVKSPFTRHTNVAGEVPKSGTNPINPDTGKSLCGVPGTAAGQLGSQTGAVVDVPDQNLIYVQNVPTAVTTPPNPNYIGKTTNPANFSCTSADNGGWSFGGSSEKIRYPLADENYVPSASPEHYGCRNGDVYVSGKLDGALTIAAENYVYVTGDLSYVDDGADILGLVGNNAVWVWNPMKVTTTSGGGGGGGGSKTVYTPLLTAKDRKVSAAILSVAHSFLVQSHDRSDSRGTLTVQGAIAQKFRGPVATTGGTGYAKLYKYDERLRFTAPPKFLSPVSTTYGISQVGGVTSAFKADGSKQ